MSDELRKKYTKQKRLTSGLFLTMALLFLTLTAIGHIYWMATVFVLCSIFTAIIFVYLQRCPGCKTRLPHDFNGICPHCGAELDDPQELK